MGFDAAATERIAGIINDTAKAAAEALKYVYAACDDYYKINIRDIFSAALEDITSCSQVNALGIKPDILTEGIFADDNINELAKLIGYSFAVRIPFIIKQTGSADVKQLRRLYDQVTANGADNVGGAVRETFEENLRLSKGLKIFPPQDTRWVGRYIYNYRTELAQINNRNLYFSGCANALMTLYYDRLSQMISGLSGR